MTLRTVTYDDEQYKLVPNASAFEGLSEIAATIVGAFLMGVPDTLPGVIEHNGEPVAWINYNVLTREERICRKPITALQPGVYINTKLFTHPAPATTQTCKGMNCNATDGISHSPECFAEHDATVYGHPVERQELSDETILQVLADNDIGWMYESGVRPFKASEPDGQTYVRAIRAIIAADRGQA